MTRFDLDVRLAHPHPTGRTGAVEPMQTITFVLDYPLDQPLTVSSHRAGGWTLDQIVSEIAGRYREVCADPQRHEVYGNSLADLHLEGWNVVMLASGISMSAADAKHIEPAPPARLSVSVCP